MDYFKAKLYAFVFWQTQVGELLGKIYDIYMHLKFSFDERKVSEKESLHFFLTKQYHIIEKGMALPEPRPCFGLAKINLLIDKSLLYIEKYEETPLLYSIAECLNNYNQFNKSKKATLPSNLQQKIDDFIDIVPQGGNGGVKVVKKENINRFSALEYEDFIRHRFSVRDFSENPIEASLIIKAIDIAKYTPSVCNRQGWNAHLYSDKKVILKLLGMQNGNGGFTHCIDKLLIVTGNLNAFTKLESNQLFTDGGLFSMSLMLSLHALGVGTCPLNTCMPFTDEIKIKKTGSIPGNERLIMMLALGNLKDEFKIAVSARRATQDIIIEH